VRPPADQRLASPLTGIEQPRSGDARIWSSRLDLDALPYLADHRLREMLVLPGAVFVELALAAATAAHGAPPRRLTRISFQRMLVLPEHALQPLYTALTSAADGALDVRSYSQPDAWSSPDAERLAHVSITIPADQRVEQPAPERLDHTAIAARCLHQLEGAAFYAQLRQRGNQYGPAFQGIAQLRTGDDEALALCRLGAADDLRAYHLHPALLDAALQLLLATSAPNDQAVVLAGIDQIELYQPPTVESWAYARRMPGDERAPIAGDVALYDEQGRIAVALRGVRFSYLAAATQPSQPDQAALQIAVAATFTAEPLADALAFWLHEFERPAQITFAPYNQLFQQLLDPSSLFARNQRGVNVALVRFEDWLHADPSRAPTPDPETRARLLGQHARHVLPNGLEIAHLNAYETAYLYDEIFVQRAYMQHGVALDDGACVIDVGANIGLFTLFVQQRWPGARVYAFEPAPPAFAALEINCALYASQATLFNCGLSDHDGAAPFTVYPRSSVFSGYAADPDQDQQALQTIVENMLRDQPALEPEERAATAQQLIAERLERDTLIRPLRTLSSMIREREIERIDLLKIDAERSELAVLRGIAAEDWPRIQQLVIEVHDRAGAALATIEALLVSRGFSLQVVEAPALAGSGLYTVYARRPAQTRPQADVSPEQRNAAALERNVADLIAAVQTMQQRSATPQIVCVCPPSAAVLADSSQRARFQQLERQLMESLQPSPALYPISSATILSTYPVEQDEQPSGDQPGHIPYTAALFAALATTIARTLHALLRPPYKVIALDCDQTLWSGLCGEDGPDGVTIDGQREQLQRFLLAQAAAGMLLCVCSKNNPDDVAAVFARHPEMPLQRESISGWRVNWQAKSANLRALADELQLGLDSFILIDDDPVECAEVQAHCPEALVLQLPAAPETIPTFLQHVWAFDQLQITAEDAQRARFYQQQRQREDVRAAALTFRDFLAGLGLQVQIAPARTEQLGRVAQLSRRTNQFVIAPRPRSAAELETLVRDGALECLAVELRDRFGDYGLVGAMLVRSAAPALIVESLWLSCRALGKGVEHRMLAWLGRLALERSLEQVALRYQPSGKNRPALDFLEATAAQLHAPQPEPLPDAPTHAGNGRDWSGLRFTYPARALIDLRYDPDQWQPARSSAAHESRAAASDERRADAAATARLLRRIASELRAVPQILSAVEQHKRRQRPARSGAAVPPTNALERTIKEVWQEVLGVEQVGIDDNFFELGGTSLDAALVLIELKRKIDVDLSAVSLFDKTTVSALADMLNAGDETRSSQRMEQRRRRGEQRRSQNLARNRRS
jgi:FkbH-like protein/FkbM family methyltransferase